MRKRTLLTVVLIGLMLLIAVLGLLLVVLLRDRGEVEDNLVSAEEVKKKKKEVIVDPYAGRGSEAIDMVKTLEVYDPDFIEAVVAAKKAEENPDEADDDTPRFPEDPEEELPPELQPRTVTIQELVERKYLENQFNMDFLERGSWRALHLETDAGGKVSDDPHYEVSLDYKDEQVTVGPVWIVNVETGEVIPRNEMAQFFEFDVENFEQREELLSRPERVVKAITSHRFESQIELGGVLLMHFMNNKSPKEGDRVIGWTVNHEFKDSYNAYFQWIANGEPKVARFVFDWAEQRLEPRGLVAIDLMAEGETRQSLDPVSIWPTTYQNKLDIPRQARWVGDEHPCKKKANKKICDAFALVLEQVDFIESVQWLLTTDKEKKEAFTKCAERKECMWVPSPNEDGTFTIKYKYIIDGKADELSFKVDPEKETIIPINPITEWAFWSVTPRT